MAYATSNPPAVLVPRMGSLGVQLWYYSSADDDASTNAANYYSNGDALGMTVGDIVFVYDSTNNLTSVTCVQSVTAGGAATTQFAAVA